MFMLTLGKEVEAQRSAVSEGIPEGKGTARWDPSTKPFALTLTSLWPAGHPPEVI